jgi:hypothetical protein
MVGTLVSKKFLKLLDEFEKSLLDRTGVEELKKIPDWEALRVSGELYRVADVLLELAGELDPTRPPAGLIELFSPSTIGRLVGQELLRVEQLPLDDVKPFYGSGIYALYYSGEFPAYRAIKRSDCPIYVGNADPVDRKARIGREQGKGIYGRLAMHRKNIIKANANLNIRDFQCRYLVTESGWQATAEEFLIWLYQPVWNKEMGVCSGFGKHGDVARKERSAWDILHYGRGWAAGQTSRRHRTAETITHEIEAHFAGLFEQDPPKWRRLFNPEWVREKFGS